MSNNICDIKHDAMVHVIVIVCIYDISIERFGLKIITLDYGENIWYTYSTHSPIFGFQMLVFKGCIAISVLMLRFEEVNKNMENIGCVTVGFPWLMLQTSSVFSEACFLLVYPRYKKTRNILKWFLDFDAPQKRENKSPSSGRSL